MAVRVSMIGPRYRSDNSGPPRPGPIKPIARPRSRQSSAWKIFQKRADYGFGEYGFCFQTPNSVSLFASTEFQGESSVSSSQPIICVQTRTH